VHDGPGHAGTAAAAPAAAAASTAGAAAEAAAEALEDSTAEAAAAAGRGSIVDVGEMHIDGGRGGCASAAARDDNASGRSRARQHWCSRKHAL